MLFEKKLHKKNRIKIKTRDNEQRKKTIEYIS